MGIGTRTIQANTMPEIMVFVVAYFTKEKCQAQSDYQKLIMLCMRDLIWESSKVVTASLRGYIYRVYLMLYIYIVSQGGGGGGGPGAGHEAFISFQYQQKKKKHPRAKLFLTFYLFV